MYREAVCGSCSTEAQLAVLGLVQPRAPAEHVGAVLSHLAFSQQVLHHHLRGSAGPEGYARKEREILHGLRVGGAFVYAPSLSFIEEVLPASIWRVVRHAIPMDAPPTAPTAFPTPVPLQASRVERLA